MSIRTLLLAAMLCLCLSLLGVFISVKMNSKKGLWLSVVAIVALCALTYVR